MCAIIDAPIGKVRELPPYEEPLPFPAAKRRHELAYEAQKRAKIIEENKCAPKEEEEMIQKLEQFIVPTYTIVGMNKDTSQLIQGKVKSKDVGKPLLPCSLGGVSYYGLCDLGSTINVIS